MAGYKLHIIEGTLNLNMNVRFENLSKIKSSTKPKVETKAPNGNIVKQTTIFQGTPLPAGSTQRKWMDTDGKEWAKGDLSYWLEGDEIEELTQTKVLELEGFQQMDSYMNNYIVGPYYELYPCDNSLKKKADRDITIAQNRNQMFKLWEYLDKENVVARGEFNASTRPGFISSDGFIRAVRVNGTKWTLEIAQFKEEKIFNHIQEDRRLIAEPVTVGSSGTKKKVRMI